MRPLPVLVDGPQHDRISNLSTLSKLVVVILVFVALAAGPALAQDAKAAAIETYKARCQACHLPDGNAPMKEMNFTDNVWKHGSRVADMVQVISEGAPGTAMLAFKSQLSEDEIVALANYVRTFDKTLKPEKVVKKKAKS
jgi:mono/diheme cytochrome c family protein